MGFMWFDPRYFLFVGPALVVVILAQVWVKSALGKWSRIRNGANLTGREVARRVLAHAGVTGVRVEEAQGFLSDHYDPRSRTVRLSSQVANTPSVAACAVAAHEVGHAIQHARHYAPLALRSAYVPIASFGSWLAFPLLFIGVLLQSKVFGLAGIILFAAIVLFQLITLPVEFDASRRAKAVLAEAGIVASREEAAGVSAVLGAAAMTYVAATLQAVAILLYYMYRMGLFGRRHD